MRALIALALALGAFACISAPRAIAPPIARIAPDVALILPSPPNFPETHELHQIIRVRRGEEHAAFEAMVSLSRDVVEIVVIAPSGPRLANIRWTAAGVEEERTALAPQGVPVENLLADLFVTLWPAESVRAALPNGWEMREIAGGGRDIVRGEGVLISYRSDPSDPTRGTLQNFAFDYDLAIITRSAE